LAESVSAVCQFSTATGLEVDLTAEGAAQSVLKRLREKNGRLDILVHSAGLIRQGAMGQASIADFDAQYAVNVRAPYELTKNLLPSLVAARGQIVFINSSVGQSVKRPEVAQYAATKHALRAIADSIREEVNPKGVRVLSLYLGRTATPMQEAVAREEGRNYNPESLLQPDDVAEVVVHTLTLPRTAEVTDISIRPMLKS
jgi:NADP-dependent 3-hydroxy acid dehydrogenase YdfG